MNDEFGNGKEAAASKDVAQRAINMVATVRGTTLKQSLGEPCAEIAGGREAVHGRRGHGSAVRCPF